MLNGIDVERWVLKVLFIEIYSQTEFLLLAWCESISDDRASLSKRLKRRDDGESSIGRYLRHLRDDVGLALGDFTNWPEWEAIDGVTVAIERLATRSRIGWNR